MSLRPEGRRDGPGDGRADLARSTAEGVGGLAIWWDPDLAIAKAKASQDHGMHGYNLIDRNLIVILAKANSIWIDLKSTG